jgi:nitronate monooxygenase
MLGIRHPILCGGLMWLADANYVAAVVNAGAMGFITALSFPDDPEGFRRELRNCRELTHGKAFGVSLAFSMRPGVNDRLAPYIDALVAERVEFIETSGASPQQWLPRLRAAGCKIIHKVPAVRYALSAEKLGVDAITVIAGEAGGHPGVYMLGNIVQGVLAADAVKLPLAVGGGMGTGRHLVMALTMGADAMIMGSRMVVAREIWAHEDYKRHVTTIDESANRVVMKIFRNNHRVLDNAASRAVAELEAQGVDDYSRYAPLVAGQLARQAYASGDWRTGMIDMGPAGVFATEITSVEEIIDDIIDEATAALDRVSQRRVT